jgi:hypothetical protein
MATPMPVHLSFALERHGIAIFLNLLIWPNHHATGFPCDPLSLSQQGVALRFFVPVSPDAALIDVLPSNTWRASVWRPLPEPTDHPRTFPLA